jgi:crotonobetainyl-CoA:carnitine CoA-transferase CaiB-like acyl-CoA transferase
MFQVGQRDESEPLVPVGGIADQLGGMMTAYAVLAGLVCRERQGIGQVVESSLLGSMIHLQAVSVNSNLWRGRPRARHSRKRARNPLGNIYLCADDEWLFLSEPQSDRFWSQFCQAVGIPELEKDTRFENAKKRADNREQLISILDEIFMKKNRKEWIEILRPTGMAVDSVLKIPDLTEDRQVLENRYIVEMDHTRLGPVKSLGFPIELSKTPPSITRCAPEFGEHTEEVLMEILGYKWNDIARLKEEGVI